MQRIGLPQWSNVLKSVGSDTHAPPLVSVAPSPCRTFVLRGERARKREKKVQEENAEEEKVLGGDGSGASDHGADIVEPDLREHGLKNEGVPQRTLVGVTLQNARFLRAERHVEERADEHVLLRHRLLHLPDESLQNPRDGREHGGPQRLEIVDDVPRVARGEPDAHAVGDAGGLHEMLEHVRHRQVRNVVVVPPEMAHLVDVRFAHRAHRHQIRVRDQRALRRTRRSRRVADHAHVRTAHRGDWRVRKRRAF